MRSRRIPPWLFGLLAVATLVLSSCSRSRIGYTQVHGKTVLYATLEDELWYVVFTDVETDLHGESPVLFSVSTDIAEQVPGFPWIGADPDDGLMFVSVEEEVEGGFEVVEHQIFPFSEGRVFLVSWEGESAMIVQLPLFPGLHGNAEEEVQRLARREEIREFLGR